MKPKSRLFLSTLIVLGHAPFALAQLPSLNNPTYPDPMRFSSLPMQGADAAIPQGGEWIISAESAYFNVWQLTWHTGTVHNELGRWGRPLQHDEIARIERDFPDDHFYHIDLEGTRSDVVASLGIGGGMGLTLRVPWIETGSPGWDSVAEWFHHRVGISQMRRDRFPRGESVVVVRGRTGTIERLSGLAGEGLGDISLSLAASIGQAFGAEHTLVVATEAPTGTSNTLQGSGGWDAGVRWHATWRREKSEVRLGLGFTRLDPQGDWLGEKRNNTWHIMFEGQRQLSPRLILRGCARFDQSPMNRFTSSDVGRTAFYWTLGIERPFGSQLWAAFDLGENFPLTAEVPDFSFHFQIGARFNR